MHQYEGPGQRSHTPAGQYRWLGKGSIVERRQKAPQCRGLREQRGFGGGVHPNSVGNVPLDAARNSANGTVNWPCTSSWVLSTSTTPRCWYGTPSAAHNCAK